jgi:6-phosphofructokinase 1
MSESERERAGYTSELRYMREVWAEAGIAEDALGQDTTATAIDAEPLYQNPLSEEEVGQYRHPERRQLTTVDEEVLGELGKRGLLPGFLEAGPRELLRLDPCRVKAAIVAVGGTAPGTNAAIHAIVRRHARYAEAAEEVQEVVWAREPKCAGGMLGIVNGFEGLMAPQPWPAAAARGPIDLDPEETAAWRDMAGCQLGLSRYDFSKGDLVSEAAENVIAAGIDVVYVIGGDGGMKATVRLWEALRHDPRGRNIVVVGLPKTMDNDIGWAWQSLGHVTALGEAARILNVLHTDARANRRVMLVELFGAEAGFVTAGAGLASGKADCVLIPEEPFDPWQVVQYVARRTREKHWALVVMAEGALLKMARKLLAEKVIEAPRSAGTMLQDPWYERRDLHEVTLKWMRDALRAEFVRPEVFTGHVVVSQPGYLIRAVPPSAEDMIYAERLGALAVDNALAGYTGCMVTQWQTHYVLVPLPLVVRVRRRVPQEGAFWKEVVASTGQPALG